MTTFCYAGDVEAGMAALAPLKEIGTPVAEVVQPMPYTGLYQLTADGAVSRPPPIRTGVRQRARLAHGGGHHGPRPGDFISPFGAVQPRVLGAPCRACRRGRQPPRTGRSR